MLKQLQRYIGNEITYNGKRCQLIEILESESSLVFSCVNEITNIQGDQHGNAHRKVHTTYTVACLSETHKDLHPTVKELLPDDIHFELLDFLLNN